MEAVKMVTKGDDDHNGAAASGQASQLPVSFGRGSLRKARGKKQSISVLVLRLSQPQSQGPFVVLSFLSRGWSEKALHYTDTLRTLLVQPNKQIKGLAR